MTIKSTNINRFLILWDNNALQHEVTWRAYDIVPAIQARHVQAALKAIGLGYAHDHALSQFCALYEVKPAEARTILGAWWLWSRLAMGGRLRVPLRARAATTLAGGSLEGPTAGENRPPLGEPIRDLGG